MTRRPVDHAPPLSRPSSSKPMSPMTKLRGENDNDDRRDQDRRKGWENAFVVLWVVLLLIGAFWLVDAFIKNSRQQECFARGGNTCVKLEIPPPAR